MRSKSTPRGVPDERPDVPNDYEYEINNSVYTVWSCAWDVTGDDLATATIENLANPYGSFKTKEEALLYLMSIGPERDYRDDGELTTLYVIERRTLMFSKFVEPGAPYRWRRPKVDLIEY